MSIRKSFYTLSQDYFFPADPHFAEQGFVEFAGYDVQATAGRGESDRVRSVSRRRNRRSVADAFFFMVV